MKTKDANGVRLYPTEEEEQTVVMHWAAMAALTLAAVSSLTGRVPLIT